MEPNAKRLEEERKRNEIKRLKTEVEMELKKIPPTVINGSINAVTHYKERAKKAQSLVRNKNASIDDLQSVLSELRGFYSDRYRAPLEGKKAA